jgi:flavin-binding protein dodecin
MPESIYKVIELIGSSATSWEDAVKNVVDTASKSLKDLRVAEVKELDVKLDDKGKIAAYRAKVRLSFKYLKESD